MNLSHVVLAILCIAVSGAANAADKDGWISLFDGKTLNGWKSSENAATFSVDKGQIVVHDPRAHLFYVGDVHNADFKNFEFQAEVLARPGANSGIFFHTEFKDNDWPEKGFEVQVDNSQPEHDGYLENKKTGSLYGVRNVYKTMAQDDKWFTMNITVHGKHVQVRVDKVLLVDYTEPENTLAASSNYNCVISHGTFALQGHDPKSETHYRNIRVKPLPDDLQDIVEPVVADDIYKTINRLGKDNYPLVDFHTHLKGGLTIDEVLNHMYQTGINHGIAVNGGIGFPITNDSGIEKFYQSMKGTPCFIGLQAEGREWPTLFSVKAVSRFDYVFTDSMTIFDQNGKRSRLWMKDEVNISDKQAFMDLLVNTIEKIMKDEPIDIYVNPTFLPDVIASEYNTLWTPERMQRVVDAAAKNGVAIEINSRLKLPSIAFVKLAKKAGIKFTLGVNNTDRDLGRAEYAQEVIKVCGIGWKDMWMPKPDGQKPIQVKGFKGK